MIYKCKICEVEFKRLGKKIPKFCSYKCRDKWRHDKSCEKIKFFSCEQCKKEFSGTAKEMAGKNRFCSQDCTNEWKKVAYTGKKRVKYVTVGCNYCGEEITRMPSKINAKNYCDKSCRGKKTWITSGLSKKMVWRPCRGVIGDKEYWFRSMWELAFAKDFLFKNKFTWAYEPKTFKLLDGSTYTPDFYIEDDDVWVEVKGYDASDSIKRFLNFRKEYTETAILANGYVLKHIYGLNLTNSYLKSLCI